MELKELLKFMTKKGASDLHLKPTRPPLLRIQGRLVPIKTDAAQAAGGRGDGRSLLTPAQRKKLEKQQSVDLGYGVTGVARFRCNIYQQRGSIAAVFRRIPFEIKNYDELNLPDVVARSPTTPPAWSWSPARPARASRRPWPRSSRTSPPERPCHIVTIEDPIEFLFADHMATVSQREVGTDTPSFHEALRNACGRTPT